MYISTYLLSTLLQVKSVHYMYFAAGLFLSTGLVAAVVSLVTAPPRDYMVRRGWGSWGTPF